MTIERVLENPHVTLSKCKPFQKPNGEIHYPYKYTLTYCYHSWNSGRELHTNNIVAELIKFLITLRDEFRDGYDNGIPIEEINAQLNSLLETPNIPTLPWKDLVEMLEKGPWK